MDETKSWTDRRAAARASWEKLIGEFEGSGKPGTAFCRDRGLPVWQFRYWLKALRPAEAASVGFVELATDACAPGVWVSCGRWRVHIEGEFDAVIGVRS